MLDVTGVRNDLPISVIPAPPPWHDHPSSADASASGSAIPAYGPWCGQGKRGHRCQRRTSARADGKEVPDGPW